MENDSCENKNYYKELFSKHTANQLSNLLNVSKNRIYYLSTKNNWPIIKQNVSHKKSDLVVNLNKEGLSVREIMLQTGIKENLIRTIISNSGLKCNAVPTKLRKYRRSIECNKQNITYIQKHTYAECCNHFDVMNITVYRFCKKYEIHPKLSKICKGEKK